MIEINDIKKSFAAKLVLSHMSLCFESGKAYGLLGGNGAGKSTLIKSIMGLLSIDSGEIKCQQGHISFLPEQPYLPENMTAWQMVSFACKMQGFESSNVSLLLEEVKLDSNAWHKKIGQYSKGMKQRTAIAYALAGAPDWLILDEPMSGLDAMGRLLILEVLKKRHKQGVGIIMCSHIVTDMVRLCDAVYIIASGEVKEKLDIENDSMEQASKLEAHLKTWSVHETLA